MRSEIAKAERVIAMWRSCIISAVEAELQLLSSGWYNVNFRGQVSACWNGITIPLED